MTENDVAVIVNLKENTLRSRCYMYMTIKTERKVLCHCKRQNRFYPIPHAEQKWDDINSFFNSDYLIPMGVGAERRCSQPMLRAGEKENPLLYDGLLASAVETAVYSIHSS